MNHTFPGAEQALVTPLVNAVSLKFDLWQESGGEDFVPGKRLVSFSVLNLLLALGCPHTSLLLKKMTLESEFNPVKTTFFESLFKVTLFYFMVLM